MLKGDILWSGISYPMLQKYIISGRSFNVEQPEKTSAGRSFVFIVIYLGHLSQKGLCTIKMSEKMSNLARGDIKKIPVGALFYVSDLYVFGNASWLLSLHKHNSIKRGEWDRWTQNEF